jgi:hypothetical protein
MARRCKSSIAREEVARLRENTGAPRNSYHIHYKEYCTMIDHDYILESLRQAVPMLRNLASRYNFDFDDLYQESYLIAARIVSERGALETLRPFIHHWIRGEVLHRAKEMGLHPTRSLDMPLHSETEERLLDRLAAPVPLPTDEEREDRRATVLYAALRRLRLSQQREIRTFYGLQRFYPHANGRAQWHRSSWCGSQSERARNSLRSHAMTELRHDQALREVIDS